MQLDARGFRQIGRAEPRRDCPRRRRSWSRRTGSATRSERRLEAAGKTLVDTTCPLVTRVHRRREGPAGAGLSRPGDRQAGARRGARDRRGPGRLRRDGESRGGPDVRRASDSGSSARRRRRRERARRSREAIEADEPGGRDPVRRHGLPADEGASAGARPAAATRCEAVVVVGRQELEQHAGARRTLPVARQSPPYHVQGARRPRPVLVRGHRGRRPDRRDVHARRDDRRGASASPAIDARRDVRSRRQLADGAQILGYPSQELGRHRSGTRRPWRSRSLRAGRGSTGSRPRAIRCDPAGLRLGRSQGLSWWFRRSRWSGLDEVDGDVGGKLLRQREGQGRQAPLRGDVRVTPRFPAGRSTSRRR